MKNVTKFLQVLMVFILFVFATPTKAQTTVTVGNGVISCNYPYATYWGGARSQFLYTAAQLTAAGAVPGTLTSIGFNVITRDAGTMNLFNIRLGNTAATTITSWTTGLTTCFSGSYAVPGTGWQMINLTTSFLWNGTSNLILEVCYDNGYNYTSYSYINGTTAPTGQVFPYWMDGSGGCTYTGASYTGYTGLPNLRFVETPLVTGNLTGTVKNCFTNAVMANVPVSCGGVGPVLTNGAGVYTLNGIIAGAQTITANFAGYVNYSAPVTVIGNVTTTYNFCMAPIPAVLTGHVTNAANGVAVKGAKVVVNGNVTYSVDGGLYTLNVFPGGSYPATFTKAGYRDTTTAAITLTSGVTTTRDMAMQEVANPPSTPFTAALNGGSTAVNLNWGVPTGNYELIYDDGIAEITTVWAAEDNLNAVKFTPLAYPVSVVGGSVNIGAAADYPSGTAPGSIHNFIVQAFDASGPGGTPGTALGHPVTVTPTSFGWNTFTLTDVSIASGNFFIVMTQKGTPPLAARLGVDTTATQLRSYSKFVTGGGPWLPANGNFLMRAVVNGVGGPTDFPASVTGYQVFRLFQTQEGTPALWTSVSAPTTTNTVDPSWPSLADSAYRWAVRTHYSNNRWSTYIFSNVIGKNRTASVTVNVTYTCDSVPKAGTLVRLTCTVPGVDSSYTKLTDNTGTAVFPAVWKGAYTLAVTRFAFANYTASVSIYGNRTFGVNLLYTRPAPNTMTADGTTLLCTWIAPKMETPLFFDNFSSGSFATNAWVADASNWLVYGAFGNPAPCARFSWLPQVTNYDYSLTSKNITGLGSRGMMLKYDIYYYMFSSDPNITMSVDINDGSGWVSLKQYDGGSNMAWTTVEVDVSAYSNKTFKIRFRSQGDDTMPMWDWDIDNVGVYATENVASCLLGYNVYLNGVLDGVTADTSYTIPGAHVVYGTTYTACVKAIYGSGYSAQICAAPFIARWLCPPTQLTGVGTENTAYLTWHKPSCSGCTPIAYIYDDGSYEMNWWIGAGATGMLGNKFTLAASVTGTLTDAKVWFVTSTAPTPLTFRVYDASYNLLYETAPFTPTPDSWNTILLNNFAFTGTFFGMVSWVGNTTSATVGLDTGSGNNAWGYYVPLGGWFSLYTWGGYTGSYMVRIDACVNGKSSAPLMSDVQTNMTAPKFTGNPFVAITNPSTTVAEPVLPEAPAAAPVLLGYNVYREGIGIAYLNNPNTLEYYDFNLNPGIYHYTVKAYYNVAPIAPLTDNSGPAGPVTVVINYGRPLPFYEPWDQGTFTYNTWSHTGNWSVSTSFGDPAPSADFSWTPGATNYDQSIESVALTAAPYSCAKIWLDFDYKLLDRNHTGAEYLTVEEFVGGAYKKVAEYSNNGDVNWTGQHFELTSTIGKAFKIRFRAHGANSLDILHWYVDNIKVYAVCTPPTALTYTQSHNIVNLSWVAPSCTSGPPAQWIRWDDGTNNDAIGTGAAFDFEIAARWDPSQIVALDGGSVTKIAFYPSSSGVATYRIRVWQGAAANMIYDQNVPSVTTDQWNEISLTTPSLIDVTQDLWIGCEVIATSGWPAGCDAGPAVVGYGDLIQDAANPWQSMSAAYGLDFNWNLAAYIETVKSGSKPVILAKNPLVASSGQFSTSGHLNNNGTGATHNTGTSSPMNGSMLKGYNVYRTDSTAQAATFSKLNTTLITGTAYTDVIPLTGLGNYKYFTTSVYNDSVANAFLCESPGTDTIAVRFPHVGIVEIGKGQIMVYPNPATDNVNVKSDYTINAIEVMNYTGQTVYKNSTVSGKSTQFNVSNLQSGIYFVKVSTEQGARSVKVTVTR